MFFYKLGTVSHYQFFDASVINLGADVVKEGGQNIRRVGPKNIRLCTPNPEIGACAGDDLFLAKNHLELVQRLCCDTST